MYEFDISPKLFTSPTMDLYKPNIIQFESLDILYKKFIELLTEKTLDISGEHGTARLGLSCTNTLNDIYKILGKRGVFPFEEVEIYQLEENINATTRQKTIIQLLTKENIKSARHSVFISPDDTVVADYNEVFDQFDDGEGLDICLLEIDKNGQVAGLSVDQDGLSGDSENVIRNSDFVSLSMSMILKSKEIVCVMRDENESIDEMLSGQKSAVEFPAKMLLVHPKVTIFYYLDM